MSQWPFQGVSTVENETYIKVQESSDSALHSNWGVRPFSKTYRCAAYSSNADILYRCYSHQELQAVREEDLQVDRKMDKRADKRADRPSSRLELINTLLYKLFSVQKQNLKF